MAAFWGLARSAPAQPLHLAAHALMPALMRTGANVEAVPHLADGCALRAVCHVA